jgi:hypothetical protein
MRMRSLLFALACLGCAACAGSVSREEHGAALAQAQIRIDECSERAEMQSAEERAARARIQQLEREVARLQSDLAQAQEVIVAAESQLSGVHTRAGAVRAIAEARSGLESAATSAPWRRADAEQARRMLGDADRHLLAGHFGAAILLASRAQRVGSAIEQEVRSVRATAGALQIAVAQGNLREGPSRERKVVATLARGTPLLPERSEDGWMLVRTPQNQLGWVHRSLVRKLSDAR